MLTSSIKKDEIKRDWYVVDADNKILGRLASEIAQVIRGKRKPFYTPNLDMGDFVVVINAEKVAVSGKKEEQKKYFKHSGYPGGDKEISLSHIRSTQPEKIIYNAKKALEKDFKPISDMRASRSYRMEVAKNLLEKCFAEIKQKKLIGINI